MAIRRVQRRRRRSERGRRLGRKIERPPAHWSLLALFLGTLVLLLFAEGLTEHTTGESGTPARVPHGMAAIPPRATLLVAGDDGQLVPRQVPVGRRIALTFDDGPDPEWTPKIAETLKRLGVPATFFVVGEHVVEDPGVVADLHDDGFEIGNHTFSHADLSDSGRLRGLQVSLAESSISGAAGIRPRFLRPPYSATPDAIDEQAERSYAAIAHSGYVIALANFDSEDWRRPGVEDIVRNATPLGKRGGVVLMHDGGGNRAETVAALERLVPLLRERGFRFVGLSTLLGTSLADAEPAASSSEHLRGELLIRSLTAARLLTDVLTVLLLPIAVLAVLRAILVVALARLHAARVRRQPQPAGFEPPVSIVVPAFNEAAGVERAVRSLAASDYPEFEVVVVDDGSTDGTGELVDALRLDRVQVLRETNRGKAAALNTGIAATRHELIAAVDADTLFEPGTLQRLVRPFADPKVGAVAGNTKVGNRQSMLGRWQHIDYVTGFNLDRRLYDVLDCMPTVPGAIGAFRRSAFEQAGGFSSATLAEDTDLTIALGRRGWKVVYAEDARAFTETPGTVGGLWRQRYRWSFGTTQAVWKHRGAILRRGSGPIGLIGLPYLVLFQIALPLLAPLIDVFALYGVVFLDPVPVLTYWLGFNLIVLVQGAYAFHLDRESPRVLWALPLQTFVYRQLMYLVVLQSVASAVQGLRLRWQHVERSGEVEVTTPGVTAPD
jgi:cellulose synthase/poly-beta-1,6-N-acetylglucosamine synthase-like glycosyltransferase/peptidoglycan/xylan/chitin deacetylase (PgdA/CDA1 family)